MSKVSRIMTVHMVVLIFRFVHHTDNRLKVGFMWCLGGLEDSH